MDLFQQLAENAHRLSNRTPEEAARQRKAARELNLPGAVVKAAPVKAYSLLEVRDSARRLKEHQKLAELAAKEYDIVKDDLEPLGTVEKYARSFGHGAVESTGRMFSGVGEAAGAAWRSSLNAFAGAFLPERPKGAHFGAIGDGDFEAGWRAVGEPVKKFSREKIDIPDGQKTFGTNVASGLGQLIPMAATAVVPGGVLVSGTAQGADAMAEEVRNDNASQQNKDLAVLGSGAFAGVSDRLVFGRIFSGSASNAARGVRAAAKRVAVGAASEGLQETSESLVNDTLRKNLTKPEHEISLAKALEGGGVGATVGGIATGIAEAALGIKNRRSNISPVEEAAHIKQQAQNIQAAQTTSRAPDLAAEYVNDVYGGSKNIYIDGEVLAQSGMLETLAEHLPERAQSIREAVATGGMVEMTRGEFHAYLPQDTQNQLAEHIRVEPDAMTAAEASVWRESGADEMFRLSFEESMQAQEAANARDMQRDTLKANLTSQLMATNRYTPEQAEVNAELAAAGYASMAQRSGMSIDELYGLMPLNVVSDGLNGEGFDQALASNPPRGWVHSEGAQDAVDLWNGSSQAQAVFWTKENPKLAERLPELAGYSHSVSAMDLNHIRKEHGNAEAEASRGQVAITEADVARIPEIVGDFGAIRDNLVSEQGARRIMFAKSFEDGTIVYLGQVSRKKKDIKTVSMWKYPPAIDEQRAIDIAVTSNQTFGTEVGISHEETVYGNDTPVDSENQLFQSAFDGTPQESFNRTAEALGGKAAHAQAVSDGLTELDYRQWVQVRTPEFKAWFGDWENDPENASKVVNPKTGEPLVVYHGSKAKFYNFDIEKQGNGWLARGFYFTPEKSFARTFGRNVSDVFLNLRNPFEVKGDNAYSDVKRTYAPDTDMPTDFSELLKANGHDGVTMNHWESGLILTAFNPNQIKSATDNSGAFSVENDSILYQSSAAARGFFNSSQNTIALLQQADASTFAHELGHFFLEMQSNLAQRAVLRDMQGVATDTEKQIVRDMGALLKWFGIKEVKASDGSTALSALQVWRDMDLEEQREYHEQFARGFESYLFEGKAPSAELRGVFRRFAAWLKHVYRRLSNLNVQLTDDVRAVYGRILASDEEIENALYENGMMPSFESAQQMGVSEEDFAKYREMGKESAMQAQEYLQGAALRDLAFVRNMRNRKVRELKKQYRADFERAEIEARRSIMSQPVYRAYQLLTAKITADDKIGNAPKKSAADRKLLDPTSDSLFVAIAKLGGLNKDELVREWGIDEKEKIPAPIFGMPVLRRKNGRSIDAMVEVLAEEGYLPLDNTGKADVRDLEERFDSELRGSPVYSSAFVPREEAKAGSHVENIYALNAVRFDAASLAGMGLSEEVVSLLEDRGMVLKNGGVHPDFVADMVLDSDGLPVYPSGEELVFALADAETPQEAIEQTAYLNLLAEKGEVPTAAAFESMADMAVHNDVRARILATEYRALSKAVGSVSLITRAAKAHAKERVAQMILSDLQPLKFTRAEAKAAKAVQAAMARGDIQAAAAHKRNQIVQNALAAEVMRARQTAAAAAKDLRALAGKTLKKTAKSYNADVMTAAQSVAAMFGQSTERRSERAESQLENVKKYDAQTYALIEPMLARAEGLAVEVDGDFSALTVEQMIALKDDVDGMMHLARRMKQVEIDGRRENIQDIQEAMRVHLDTLPKKWANKGESGNLTAAERALSKFYEARAALMRVESWAEMMDGQSGGVFKKYIFQPVKDAADNYRTDKGAFLRKYRDIINEVDFGGGKINAPELGFTFGNDSGGSGMNELMHAILHTGNASNKRKLLLGRKWAVENEDGSLNTQRWDGFIDRMISEGKLTKQHFDIAQKVWDLLEEMKPMAQKTHREVFGYYFDEVTAEPFMTPFGEYRGGYVPAMTDTRLSIDADIRDLHNSETESMQFAFPTTSKGFTKSRVEYNSPLLLNMNSLSGHIDKVLKFSHLEIPVRDVSRIMSGLEKEIDAVSPKAISGMIKPWLSRVATQQLTTSGKADAGFGRVMSVLRNRAGMAAMIGNIPNAVQQLAGYTVASVKVKPSFLTAAAVEYIKNPKEMAQSVAQASQYMDARLNNQIGLMTENIEQIVVNPNAWQKFNRWGEEHAYFAQSFVDSIMSVGIWQAAYNQAVSDGLNHKDAVRFADGVIRQTQGSVLVEDVSRVETGHPFMRLFTQFYGYFNMLGNLLVAESKIASRSGNVSEKAQRLAYIWGVGYLLNVFAAEALIGLARGGVDDEDDDGSVVDDWLKQVLVMSPVKTAAAMIPQGGNVVNLLDNKVYNDRAMSSPAVGMIESGVKAVTLRSNVEKQSGIRDAASALAMFGGVPLAPLAARPAGYLYGVSQGNIGPTSDYDLIRGTVTGVASPESKK